MIEQLLSELTFIPEIHRKLDAPPRALVIGGMGGSALAGDALAFLLPERQIVIHREYGLPHLVPKESLYIAISYSGNTEETLSFANDAASLGHTVAVVTSGGKLAGFAERSSLPICLVPTGLAPRNALIYLVRALLAFAEEDSLLSEMAALTLDSKHLTDEAEQDAHFMLQSVPLFYTSTRTSALGRIGKLIMNETARTPAFMNVFSELNHNEMQAFDTDMPEGLEHLFRFVLVRDALDDARIARRMDAFTSLMEERGRLIHELDISEMSKSEALVSLWIRFLLAARSLAETRNIHPDEAPLIEAFKKLL